MADKMRLYVRESTGGCLDGYYYDWDEEFLGRKFIFLTNPRNGKQKKIFIENLQVFNDYAVVKNSNITIIFKNK